MMRFAKEFFLLALFAIGLADMWKKRFRPVFDRIDLAIGLYIVSLLVISVITGTSLT